jgi:RecB family exonuclease
MAAVCNCFAKAQSGGRIIRMLEDEVNFFLHIIQHCILLIGMADRISGRGTSAELHIYKSNVIEC